MKSKIDLAVWRLLRLFHKYAKDNDTLALSCYGNAASSASTTSFSVSTGTNKYTRYGIVWISSDNHKAPMRFFADGPNIPDELLEERDRGNVVLLCWYFHAGGLAKLLGAYH